MMYLVLETFKDNFNELLKENGIFLAIGIAVAIAFVVLVIVFNKKK